MAKGQAFLSDFSVSIAVFGIIVVAFFIPWNSVVQAETRFSAAEEMKTQARRTASFLVSTEGYPNNWEENDVKVVIPGFANQDNVLSIRKLREFAKIEYKNQRSLLKNQGFSLEFYDTSTGELLEYNSSEYEQSKGLGTEPVAYMVQDTSFSNLEMLDDLNNSDREWYFYFPSTSNQDQLEALTAEKVYTNGGNVGEMYEKMITDATDKGWSQFKVGNELQADNLSFTGDVDGDGGLEMFYKGPNDRLNYFDIGGNSTETLSIGTSFQRMGAVANFTAEQGLELAYVDGNDQLAFYNYETGSVTGTSQGAKDIGGSMVVGGERRVFFVTSNDNLAYYSAGSTTVTSANAGRVGGTGDIDSDGNMEVAYQNGADNLAFYDVATDSSESTSFQVTDVGGVNGGLVAVKSGNNDYLGMWNYSASSFNSTGLNIGSVGSLTGLNSDEGLDVIAIDSNGGLGYYDFSLGMNYRTVIVENVGVQPDNAEFLRSAVEKGATFLQSGPSSGTILTQTFNMNYEDPGSQTVEVQKVSPLLNSNFSEGDQFTFSSDGGFTGIDVVFANSTGTPSTCMACMQRFDEGKVYYIADMETSSSNQTAFTRPDRVISNALVFENPFNVGKDIPDSAETVVVVDRQVVVNKSGEFEKAELRYKVWR
ncbi:MAG: hypothetical protein ABEK00_01760 [Candidatus Nanohaloarchaea archaeon]